ncbi:MAG TPA: FtsQ-type POTRA domain-containing protein [Acidisarcina sp.]
MAKIEKTTSRAPALAADDFEDSFLPLDAAPRLRAGPLPRFQPEEDAREEDAFLRTRRRVPVRRGILPRTRRGQIALAAGTLLLLGGLGAGAIAARDLLKHDPRFRIDSSDSIQVLGNSEVTRAELLSVFGSDIGRNVFFIPLAERRRALENLPWVEHATVMRLLPNQMRVAILERTPIAFLRTGNSIGLVDASGVILPMPHDAMEARHYSFPVVTGIDAADPLSTRTARMHIYQKFIADLDASGEGLSAQISEVDLSDPEDVRAVVPSAAAAADQHDLLLHFGDADFLARFHNYQAHLAEWRQQYPHLASIDLRYDRQVVLEMDKSGTPAPAPAAQDASAQRMGKDVGSLPAGAVAAPHQHSTAAARPAARAAAKAGHGAIHKPARPQQPAARWRPYATARPAEPSTEAAQ